MNKKVSIVVPVYNVELHLKRCIDSLIIQSYENIELILVDDCSKDNSLLICHEYANKDNRVKVIEKKENTGQSDTRNIGIENSTGEYIMFADSDDYVCENFVEEMVRAIEEKNVDVVRCKTRIQKKDGSFSEEDIYNHKKQIYGVNKLKELAKSFAVHCDEHLCAYVWTMIIRRNKLNVKFNTSIHDNEDLIFVLELLLESIDSIYFLDKFLYYYCYNNASITKNSDYRLVQIYQSVASTKEIKKVLSRNDLLDEKIDKQINYAIIKNDVHKLYFNLDAPVLEIRKRIKKAFKNKELEKMINNIDLKSLTLNGKGLIILLKLHFYFLIAIYMKLRKRYLEN